VYKHTHTRTGIIAQMDYSTLAQGIEVSESHSAIVESQASNSSVKKEAFTYKAGTPEEMARSFKQQPKSRENSKPNKNLSIPSSRYFRNCLSPRRKSRRPRLLPRSPGANGRKGRAHLLHVLKMKSIPTLSHPSLHLKRRLIQRMGVLILKG